MLQAYHRVLIAALGLASSIDALLTYTPSSNAPTFRIGIPSGSGISSSATGTIYFSVSAPSRYQWVGLGMGTAMRNAQVFVVYADGSGNVTVSARDAGQGHVEPKVDSTLSAGVELLAGSYDDGTNMVANVRCTSCKLASGDSTSTKSPWIMAWLPGTTIVSNSAAASIEYHGASNHQQVQLDLTQASVPSDTNPFVAGAVVTPSGTVTSSSGTPASTSGSQGSSGSSGASAEVGPSLHTISTFSKAHGTIMGLTVVILFPLGSIVMRLLGSPMFHAALQVISLILLIIGFSLGVKLAQYTELLYKGEGRTHTIFGTVILALFIIQPFFGILHHNFYKKYQARSAISHTHIWFGRIIMLLAIINGGLGLKLAANTTGGEIAYGVIAGIMAVIYAGVIIFKRKKTETRWNFKKEPSMEMANRS